MGGEVGRADVLRPIKNTSKYYYAVLAAAGVGALLFAIAFGYQLEQGLAVTGLGDWGSGGGSTWGLYIGAFIWWVGIAHGGIILSAAVRLLGMKRYQPVARMAELLTIGALSMAGMMILVHMGRPDRMVWSIFMNYPQTVHNSPLVWDVTVITLYFVLTATYLVLTLRYDVYRLRDELPDLFDPIYEVLLIGYSEDEDPIIERMVWWLALGIIILAPLLLHGGVIPWLFALLPSMPGWYDAVQGPQFLTIALTSAIGSLLIISAIFRKLYDWDELFSDDVFRGLGLWLAFFALLFLWLQLQQIITGVYHPPTDVYDAAHGVYSTPLYWLAIGMVLGSLAYLTAMAIDSSLFTKRRTVAAGFFVVTATLIEKILFVAEGLIYANFDLYRAVPGDYFPSFVEMAILLGTISMIVLFFAIVTKVVPVVELHAVESHGDHGGEEVEA